MGLFQSTHPVGRDPAVRCHSVPHGNFNPLAPWRDETVMAFLPRFSQLFQSTCPVEGQDTIHLSCVLVCIISIHPPCRGVGQYLCCHQQSQGYCNPPTPWARPGLTDKNGKKIFISIHPLRRERDVGNLLTVIPGSISIHSPHEGETCSSSILFSGMKFQSTHPEWDGTFGNEIIDFSQVFQSTRSAGGENTEGHIVRTPLLISIRSPRAGRDTRLRNC